MKSIGFLIGCVAILWSCSSPVDTATYPAEKLLSYANISEFGKVIGDTTLKQKIKNEHLKLLDSTRLLMDVYLFDVNKPFINVTFTSAAKNYPPSEFKNLPPMWKSRDGIYAWITIDSLQLINGKPFYLEYDGKGQFEVVNWEQGKLAKSGIDIAMTYQGSAQPDHFISSQQIIDKKWDVKVCTMTVWGDEWPRKNLAPTNGLAGDYTMATAKAITEADIRNLNVHGLLLMRNEIFARHGYIFHNDELKEHFQSKRWYQPRFQNVNDQLTEVEKKNLEVITAREAYLYLNRPIVELIKELPLLTLPTDLRLESFTGTVFSNDIENPDGEILLIKDEDTEQVKGFQQKLFGLLPDTSGYYGVLWQGAPDYGLQYGDEVQLRLSTFTKTFQPLGHCFLSFPPDPYRFVASGDCNEDIKFESQLNTDLTFFLQLTTVTTGCDDKVERERISGKVNKNGTISVTQKSF